MTADEPATPAGWQHTVRAPLDPRYTTAADAGYPDPAPPPGRCLLERDVAALARPLPGPTPPEPQESP